jgi:competence protein ComEC
MAGERVVMTVDGFVVDVVSPGAGGPRLLIAPVAISRLAPEDTPKRVRVTSRREHPRARPGRAPAGHAGTAAAARRAGGL